MKLASKGARGLVAAALARSVAPAKRPDQSGQAGAKGAAGGKQQSGLSGIDIQHDVGRSAL